MKKKLYILFVACFLINGVFANSGKKMTLVVNNIVFENETFIVKNDRIHLPIRIIAENLGADVKWNNEERSVNVFKDGKNVKFIIDSNEVFVSSMCIKIDSAPFIFNDMAYVPIRALANGIDASIKWDEVNFTCYVDNGFEMDDLRPFDSKKDSKNLSLIQNIRKVNDRYGYLEKSEINIEDTGEVIAYTLFLKDYNEDFMSMKFVFNNKSMLQFYKFSYLPSEVHPFYNSYLSYKDSQKLAQEFLNLVGNKGRILKENELNKYQEISPEGGLYFFYTSGGSNVLVDASLGLVCAYGR